MTELDDFRLSVERSAGQLDADGVVDHLAGEPAVDEKHVFGFLGRHLRS
ncbi:MULTISPECIES: hypothetical protein [unclassified Streptomyces]|nr:MULTISPECIES: hypothetical protein [unclassified Streptomyces]MBK3563349.1 hypothetical protein [Streptomyces sp. MBT62]MBK6012122.1 hypothetical protein [Streptomyces sp. MBT53]